MRAFDYEHRSLFFGRDQQSYALYRLTYFGFIAVIGNSGSGKSSLVRAGLFPLLTSVQELRPWRIATMTPGGAPLERLADAIASLGPEDEAYDARTVRRERIEYLLRRSSSGIADALDEISQLAGSQIMLAIDQFEEIFRYGYAGELRERDDDSPSRDETAAFVQLLLQLHRRRSDAHVLVTMRSDFIGDCAQFAGLPEAVSDTQFLVPSLSRSQRREAICKPLERAGATIDPTLVERLLNDASYESDQLPVLQHALSRMWIVARDRDPAQPALTMADYEAVGTLRGALSQHADAVTRKLEGLEHVVEAVFRALSERDPEGRATRRVITLRELIAETGMAEAEIRTVVDRFRADDCNFLLPAGGGLTLDTRIDVVHEALLRRWERMTSGDPARPGWLEREEEDGRYYRSLLARIDGGETTLQLDRVRERYAWWTSIPRTAAWAKRYGGRYERVEAFFAQSLTALADAEAAQARAEEAERERLAQRAATSRRFLLVSGSIAAVALVLLVITFIALLEAQRTTNRSLVAQSRLLARDALTAIDRGDAADGALLALEALPKDLSSPDRPFTWEAYGALRNALANLREQHTYRFDGRVIQVRLSPDETRFLATTADGTVQIWKRGAHAPERILRGHRLFVSDIAFSPNHKLLVTASYDGTARIWDAVTYTTIHVLRGHTDRLSAAAFSPDGRHVLTSSADGTARIYDVATGASLRVLGTSSPISSAAYVADGKHILVVAADGTAALWDPMFRAKTMTFRSTSPITNADASRDGKRVVTVSTDLSGHVWDAQTGKPLVTLSGHGGPVHSVQFSRDGTRAFIVGPDKTDVWDTRTGAQIAGVALGGNDKTSFQSVSPNEKTIVSENYDGTVDIWSADTGARVLSVGGSEATTFGSAVTRDGSHILTSSDDGTVREYSLAGTPIVIEDTGEHNIYPKFGVSPAGAYVTVPQKNGVRIVDSRTGRTIRTLPVDADCAQFAPVGDLLVVCNYQSGDELWDWRRAVLVRTFVGGPDPWPWAAFSPDGTRIAAVNGSRVYVLDARSGRRQFALSANDRSFQHARFSPDGTRILTAGNDGWLRIWDATSGRPVFAFKAHQNQAMDARYSPDGRMIVSASFDRTVRVWDATDGTLIATQRTAAAAVTAAFSSDGGRILISSEDGARVWDYRTGAITFSLLGFRGSINQGEFVADGRRVATYGSDGTERIWTIPDVPACRAAIETARAKLPHGLTGTLADAEFITPRRAPSLLNVFLPRETCR